MAEQEKAKSAADIEKEQEEMLKAKYGALKPKKKGLIPKEHKFFDSADWALGKEAAAKGQQPPAEQPEALLPPKLEPTPVPARRVSHLEPMDKAIG